MDVEFRLIGVSRMGDGFLRLRLPTSFFVLMLAFWLEGCGPSSSSSNQPNPQSLSGTIDSLVQTEMQYSGVPGMTVAHAKNGAMLYSLHRECRLSG
jgi:hypothetical protein